jgi:dolichol-phosphate mannosyltransferase
MPSLLVLLPCYNEERALTALLGRLAAMREKLQPDWNLSVLVVDDGSSDGTAACASAGSGELVVQLVRHGANRGLGAALRTGIEHFLEWTGDNDPQAVLAVMDADGTHPPELLSSMLARLDGKGGLGDCDVVIASRYAPGGEEHGLPLLRWLYSRLASLALRLVARIPGVRDYTCGYRLYRAGVLRSARELWGAELVTETSFVCMAELLVKLGRGGARIDEVPLSLHYELKGGPSKMNVAATIRRYVVLAWHIVFSRSWR